MKTTEVKEGMLVVVNRLPDATIYKVNTVNPKVHLAHLVYRCEDGTYVSGGAIDCSYLMKPNQKQLKMYGA